MSLRSWKEKVDAIDRYARECYSMYKESAVTRPKTSAETRKPDNIKRNDISGYEQREDNALRSRVPSEIRIKLFEKLMELGFFEHNDNYYIVEYNAYTDTYVFRYGAGQKHVIVIDIADIPGQIIRAFEDYAKAADENTLRRVSRQGKPYSVTFLGVLNSKLLNKRDGYAYCAATGGSFREYSQFDRDLVKFGKYIKKKTEAADALSDSKRGSAYADYGIEGDSAATQSSLYVLASLTESDYDAIQVLINRHRNPHEYIDGLKQAYIARFTLRLSEQGDLGGVHFKRAEQTFDKYPIENDGQYMELGGFLKWLDALVFNGKKRRVSSYWITTVITRMLIGLESDLRARATRWLYDFCIREMLYNELKVLMMSKEPDQTIKFEMGQILYAQDENPPFSDVDLDETGLCCDYPSIFIKIFALGMFAEGRIAGKPDIAAIAGVTEPTVDCVVKEFCFRAEELKKYSAQRYPE